MRSSWLDIGQVLFLRVYGSKQPLHSLYIRAYQFNYIIELCYNDVFIPSRKAIVVCTPQIRLCSDSCCSDMNILQSPILFSLPTLIRTFQNSLPADNFKRSRITVIPSKCCVNNTGNKCKKSLMLLKFCIIFTLR